MSIEGTWNISLATPIGTRTAVVELSTQDGTLHGLSTGETGPITLTSLEFHGNRLTWIQSVTKPMRMNLAFDVTVEGDDMTGTAKGGIMPASKVTGQRTRAAQPS